MIRWERQIVTNEVIYHFNHIPKTDFPFLNFVTQYFYSGVTIRYMLDITNDIGHCYYHDNLKYNEIYMINIMCDKG